MVNKIQVFGYLFRRLSFFFETICLLILWFFRNFAKENITKNLKCLEGKTAIVTGGRTGIGFSTCLLLASRGCKVIIACRSDATEAVKNIIETTGNTKIFQRKLDLASLKSVCEFAETINREEKKIDILINNAGVGTLNSKISDDGLNPVMQTNFFGPFLLTTLLFDSLNSSEHPRVIFTTSVLASIQNLTRDNLNMTVFKDNFVNNVLIYANSKYCNILVAQEFARRFSRYGIQVYCSDVGISKTDIYDNALTETNFGLLMRIVIKYAYLFSKPPLKAALTTFHLTTADDLENGQVYFRCKPFKKRKQLENPKFCEEIWNKTEELLKLKPVQY